MAQDDERLAILIEGKVNDFEKAMKSVDRKLDKLGQTGNDSMRKVQASSDRAARALEADFARANSRVVAQFGRVRTAAAGALGGIGVGGAGLLAGFSAAGVVAEVRQATEALADLDAEAKRAGLSVEQFQELKFAFGQERISIDALTDGLKELQLRADEFISTGKGSGAEAFQRLGYSAQELAGALKDPKELLLDILDRLKDFDKAAQIRIFDELAGGTGGEQFVQLLAAGSDKLRESIQRARDLGLVLSEEVVADAVKVNKEFDVLAEIIDTRVKSGLVDLAKLTLEVAGNIQSWATAADGFLTKIGNSGALAQLNQTLAAMGLLSVPDGMTILDPALRGSLGQAPLQVPEVAFDRSASQTLDAHRTGGHVNTAELGAAAAAGAAAVLAQHPGLQVSSAFRSPEYNRSVGGAPNSRHTHGDAVDFVGVNESNVGEIVRALQAQGFRGFGYYNNGSLHADMGAQRAWGPDRTAGSLGQTPLAFQQAVVAGPQLTAQAEHGLYQKDVAADDASRAKAEQERLALLNEQNAARERQQEAITAVNEALAQELEMAGIENELRTAGKLTLDEVNAALDQESLVRQKLNELEAAGVTVTTEMEQAIRAKIGAVFELQAANETLVASQEKVNAKTGEMASAFQAVGQPIVDTFLSIIDGSAKAEDAIKGLIKQLAQMLMQGALFGGGPLGKLFGGGLLGGLIPGRAVGGPVGAGQPYMVGERGPELFMPNVSGRILPRLSEPMGGGRSGGRSDQAVHVTVGWSRNADGNLKPFIEDVSQSVSNRTVRAGLTQYDREMQGAPLLGRIDKAREKY